MEIAKSLFYFIVAGFFEIGGGYLVWLALKEDKGPWYLVAGASFSFYTVSYLLCRRPRSAAFMRRMAVFLLFCPYYGAGRWIKWCPIWPI
mgnify:CR=1 FL=1